MNKKYILNYILTHLEKVKKEFTFSIKEDHLLISKNEVGFLSKISIRCQSFGDIYILNPQVFSIKNTMLESIFSSLINEELKFLYNGDSTLTTTSASLKLENRLLDYEIQFESQLNIFIIKLNNLIENANMDFFEPMKDPKSIAKFIGKYAYKDNLKVNSGGQFPVQIFKKIFLLYIGNQRDRYQEYKNGLYNQLETLPLRKPEKKEETILFVKNLNYLIQELESGNVKIPTI